MKGRMEIEEKSYASGKYCAEAAYIHRYYLPKQLRKNIQHRDLAAVYDAVQEIQELISQGNDAEVVFNIMSESLCRIRYLTERIVKEIPEDLMPTVVDCCIKYYNDKRDWIISCQETNFLIALNDRLRLLEHDINTECFRLNREIHARQKKGESFLEDFDIEVTIGYKLRDDHSLSCEDDDNIIFEWRDWKTARPENLEEFIRAEREQEKVDWNDTRGVDNPDIRNNPLFDKPFGWLFHRLQSHSPAPLKHICGIGAICVDIQIRYQEFIEIDKDLLFDACCPG